MVRMAQSIGNELDTVAAIMAKPYLLLVASENRVFRYGNRHDGPIGFFAGVVGGLWYAVSFGWRTIRSPDPRDEAQALYQRALAVDRDRARADLLAVADRLSPLDARDGPDPSTLILSTARHLVRWVASDRPIDDETEAVERAFARLCEVVEAKANSADLVSAIESYCSAWADRPTAGQVVP